MRRKEKKVQRTVTSFEIRNLRTVVAAYALASVVFLGFLPLAVIVSFLEESDVNTVIYSYTGALVIAGVVVGLYFVLAAFRVLQYYRQKFLFQKALWRVLPAELQTIWRRMVLWKLRVFFYGSAVMPAFIVLYGVGSALFGVFLVLGLVD